MSFVESETERVREQNKQAMLWMTNKRCEQRPQCTDTRLQIDSQRLLPSYRCAIERYSLCLICYVVLAVGLTDILTGAVILISFLPELYPGYNVAPLFLFVSIP